MVADQRQRAAEPQRGQCLVGARLVRLVEDHDVEVHVGDRRRCRGGARGEVAVGFEQARVVLVVAAKPLHGGMHALGARNAHGAHAGRARQALQCVVDGEIGMRGDQDALVSIACQAPFHGFDDHRRLARSRRTLDEDGLTRRELAEQRHGAVLRWVGDHALGQP